MEGGFGWVVGGSARGRTTDHPHRACQPRLVWVGGVRVGDWHNLVRCPIQTHGREG